MLIDQPKDWCVFFSEKLDLIQNSFLAEQEIIEGFNAIMSDFGLPLFNDSEITDSVIGEFATLISRSLLHRDGDTRSFNYTCLGTFFRMIQT